jgi:hypothetical protein
LDAPAHPRCRQLREDVGAGVGRERLREPELRIEVCGDSLLDRDHLEQQRQVRWDAQSITANDLEQVVDRASESDFADAAPDVAA